MAEPKLPDDPLSFIRDCLRGSRIYPEDKYFPSYLLLGRLGEEAFHVLFGTDMEGQNVRIVTAYYPSLEDWEADLKTRRRSR